MNEEKTKQIQDLAKRLIQLTEESEGNWQTKDGLTSVDNEQILELGERTDYIGTIVRMIWFLLKDNQELKDKLTELELKIKSNDITVPWNPNPWPNEPITPYIPYPSTPNIPWYQYPQITCTNCTYTDTDGNKFDIDCTRPMSVTYTYSTGVDNLRNPFDEK